MEMKHRFVTRWTAEKIKEFRSIYYLTQENLAALLTIPQQRVSDWESGRHSMKRAYTILFDQLDLVLERLRREAKTNSNEFAKLIKEEYGVRIRPPKQEPKNEEAQA